MIIAGYGHRLPNSFDLARILWGSPTGDTSAFFRIALSKGVLIEMPVTGDAI